MSWKPYRGGRVLLDKHIKIAHEFYFKFWETTDIKEKSKIAFKLYKSHEYLNQLPQLIGMLAPFIEECKEQKTNIYKPFLKIIENV